MLLCATGRKGWEKRDANNQENPQRGGSIPIFITAFATTCSNRGKAQSLWWLLRAGFPEIPTPAPRIRAISKVHSTTCTHSQKPCALSRHSEHICKEPGNLSGLLLLQVQSQKTLANSKADLRWCNYPPPGSFTALPDAGWHQPGVGFSSSSTVRAWPEDSGHWDPAPWI